MTTAMTDTAANVTTLPYAGFGRRFYAYMIDQSVIQGLALAMAYPIGSYLWGARTQSIESLIEFLSQMMPIVTVLQVAIGIGYGMLLEGSASGATWGKRYCGLRVVTEDSLRLSYGDAFMRNVGINLINMVLYFSFLGSLAILPLYLTPLLWEKQKRQTVFDRMLRIVVIRTK